MNYFIFHDSVCRRWRRIAKDKTFWKNVNIDFLELPWSYYDVLCLARGYWYDDLEELTVCKIDDNILNHLYYNCPNLRKITIVKPSLLHQLVDFSFLPSSLQSLDITCGRPQAVFAVPPSIIKNVPLKNLQVLVFRKAYISKDFFCRLTESRNLIKLKLQWCLLTAKCFEKLANTAPRLEIIELYSCGPRKEVAEILQLIPEQFDRLRVLTICGVYARVPLGKIDLNLFFTKLARLKNLQIVNISGVESATVVEEEAWTGFKKLEQLKLTSGYWITDNVLSNVVKHVKTLQRLKVICAYCVNGAGLIAIDSHPNLRYILLYRCSVSPRKIDELKRTVKFEITNSR